MTTEPRPPAQLAGEIAAQLERPIAPRPIITDAERFLHLLVETSDESGWLEVVAGRTQLDANGEPTDKIELLCWSRDNTSIPHTRKFFFVEKAKPETRATPLAYARSLRDRYGNAYIGRALYSVGRDGKPHRDEALAIPNRLVFVDDVKPEQKHDFAIYIQTSETKGHAYKLLDRSLNAMQYDDVARRLAAHYGADPSGVDYVQLGRWPNTTNTKGNAGRDGYRVRMTRYAPEQVETLESIRVTYPQPEGKRGSTHAARLAAPAPGDWRGLPDGKALIASGRWRWMCENRPQIKMLLDTHERVITYRETGQADTTDSAQRAAITSNLLQLHRPPPLAEIRAVALALKPHIGADLTDAEYRDAIDREIATYLHVHYTAKGKEYRPSPTTGIKATPRPRGRAYAPEQTRAAQLDRVRTILRALPTSEYGTIAPDAAAIGAELGKSPKMVRNYLHDLAEQKEISFAASGKGRKLALILTNRFGMPNQPTSEKEIKSAPETPILAPVSLIAAQETPIAAPAPLESTGDLGGYVLPPTRESVSDFQPTDQAPAQPPLPTPTLRELVTTAIAELPRERPNEATGQLMRWPVTDKRVLAYVHAVAPGRYRDHTIRFWAAKIRKERTSERFEQVRKMSDKALGKAIAGAGKTMQKLLDQAAQSTDEAIKADFEKMAKQRRGNLAMLQREENRRADAAPVESKVEQRLLLAEIEQQRAPALRTHRSVSVVSVDMPIPAPEPAHEVEPSGAQLRESLLARLFARQAGQAVAQ